MITSPIQMLRNVMENDIEYEWLDILKAFWAIGDYGPDHPSANEVQQLMLDILKFNRLISLKHGYDGPHIMGPNEMLWSFAIQSLGKCGDKYLSVIQPFENNLEIPLTLRRISKMVVEKIKELN